MVADVSESMITIEKVKLSWNVNPILSGGDIEKFLDTHKGNAREYFDHAFRVVIGNYMRLVWTWWRTAEELCDSDFSKAVSTSFDALDILEKLYDQKECRDKAEIVGGEILNIILSVMFKRFDLPFVPEYWRYVSFVQQDKLKEVGINLKEKDKNDNFFRDITSVRNERITRFLTIAEIRDFKETTLQFYDSTGIVITRYSFQYKNPFSGYIELLICLLRIVNDDVGYWDRTADDAYRIYTKEEHEIFDKAYDVFYESSYNTLMHTRMFTDVY